MSAATDKGVLVTKESFYAVVGDLNVHPFSTDHFIPNVGYQSDWKLLRTGERIASSIGSDYSVTPEFYEQNRAVLARCNGGAA